MYEHNKELYKVSESTKKMQVWRGWAEGSSVFCSWGELGGKQQTKVYTAEPKNVGRSNETSAEQQAEIELQAMYQSQVDNKHYRVSQIQAVESSEACHIPRKITNYKDRWEKMSDNLLSSLKLNGSRACVVDGVLYSKIGRAEDVKVTHLREAIEKLNSIGMATFDSEVYAHGLSLQRIRSAWLKPEKTEKEVIKIGKDRLKDKGGDPKTIISYQQAVSVLGYDPNEDAEKLKFHVFDIPDDTGLTFEQRVDLLYKFKEKVNEMGLSLVVKTVFPFPTDSHKQRMSSLAAACDDGYEGLVHYEPKGVYEYGKRSTNTAKSKPRLDAEAKVMSVSKDKNGEGVLSCTTSDELGNIVFKCKMKVERRDGTRCERDYESMLTLVGKWITFSYEELSDKGVPTKPVGEIERICDDTGSPLE